MVDDADDGDDVTADDISNRTAGLVLVALFTDAFLVGSAIMFGVGGQPDMAFGMIVTAVVVTFGLATVGAIASAVAT